VVAARFLAGPDAACYQAVLASRVQVSQENGDRLPDEPTAIEDEAETTQPEAGVL
jgi:hypothetical protein